MGVGTAEGLDDEDGATLQDGTSDLAAVGFSLGKVLGKLLGSGLGRQLGAMDGAMLGDIDGGLDGLPLGYTETDGNLLFVGSMDGNPDGKTLGFQDIELEDATVI